MSRRIAVASDTHDALDRVLRLRAELEARGVGTLIHCGDITGPAVVRALDGLEVHWVFGNCDHDRPALEAAMRAAGHRCHGPAGELEFEGRRIAFTHGDRAPLLAALLASGHDIVLHGHTHLRRDERIGASRVLCPGALYHVHPATFAILTVPALDVEWVELG